MLATLGDLLEDVVVRLDAPIQPAADTPSHVERRRGGSAANVAVAAARLGHPVRFLGQVGDDTTGRALIDVVAADGVDTSHVRRGGTTGAIVVLVDPAGERSMLTDRGACVLLDRPEPAWIDGVTALHIPLYSLAVDPLARTTRSVVGWAHDRGIAVSIDVSSTTLIAELGTDAVLATLSALRPAVVLANADEARALAIDGPLAGALTIVKRGADPAIVHQPAGPSTDVAAIDLGGTVDTTGAGDAFAAGFLTGGGTSTWRRDPVAACRAGHAAAAALLRAR